MAFGNMSPFSGIDASAALNNVASMGPASALTNGYLTSVDWVIFNAKEPAITKLSAFNKAFGTIVDTVAQGNDSRILDGETAYGWGTHAGLYSLIDHNHSLDTLINVTISANSNGEILRWTGSTWANNTLIEAGIIKVDQTTGQIIGLTGARLTKLWATDIDSTSITASTLVSTVVVGTSPLTVTSTTLVSNLNADTVDGYHAGLGLIGVGTQANQILVTGTTPFTPTWTNADNITSLNALSFASISFVKLTAANTFGLDTNIYIIKSGDTGLGNMTFVNNSVIDVASSVGSDVLNIGTGNADIVNIGYAGSVVNINGTLSYQLTDNLSVKDKLITLNKGGGVASATSSGFELEENSIITGWFTSSAARTGFELRAPAISYSAIFLLSSLSAERTYTFPDVSGTVALISNLHNAVTLATDSGLALSTQVLNMGTPSTVTSSTSNAVSTNTHSHAITAGLGFIGNGSAANQILVTGTTPFAPSWTLATNLVSLNALNFASTSFVKMSSAGVFGLDTSTYLSLTGGTLTGNLLFTDNILDIGASGATRPRTGYFGTSVVAPNFTGVASKATNLVGGNSTTTLGSIGYQSNTDVTTMIAPNTSTTLKFLSQTGTGSNGAAPAWHQMLMTELPPLANDTWLTALNYAGGTSNLFKLSADNVMEFASAVKICALYHVVDSGTNDIVDIPVSAAAASGTKNGVGITIGGTRLFEIAAEKDATTGILGGYMIIPKMTTTQRDAITAPVEGMFVYNLTTHVLNFRSDSAWAAV